MRDMVVVYLNDVPEGESVRISVDYRLRDSTNQKVSVCASTWHMVVGSRPDNSIFVTTLRSIKEKVMAEALDEDRRGI